MAVETELINTYISSLYTELSFDDSNSLLIYSSIFGIKIYSLKEKKVVKILGKLENMERFIRL